MICPRCRQFTPDEGFACIQCGAAVQRANPAASAERASSGRHVSRSFFRPWMLAVLALVALLGYVAYGRLNRSHAANAFAPGAELAVENYLARGRTTIVDFYSDYCPPCRKMAPLLARRAKFLFDDISRNSLEYGPLAELSSCYCLARVGGAAEAGRSARQAFARLQERARGDFMTRLWLFYDAYVYGRIMDEAGDRAEAARGFRACIAANPHTELAARARRRLGQAAE